MLLHERPVDEVDLHGAHRQPHAREERFRLLGPRAQVRVLDLPPVLAVDHREERLRDRAGQIRVDLVVLDNRQHLVGQGRVEEVSVRQLAQQRQVALVELRMARAALLPPGGDLLVLLEEERLSNRLREAGGPLDDLGAGGPLDDNGAGSSARPGALVCARLHGLHVLPHGAQYLLYPVDNLRWVPLPRRPVDELDNDHLQELLLRPRERRDPQPSHHRRCGGGVDDGGEEGYPGDEE
mmetsp:Transcript_16252/g.43297  ORF Transcript_16252/g.43297 Transcript_16252/m.43297 type:complete len:238 (-) Transcript_16252:557-1270(-)